MLLAVMFYLLERGYSYWFVLLLAPLASLFLVRMFLVLHDCAHKSFWRRSPLACFIIGHICGIFTFTAFFDFRQSHVIHHATVANLEKRGVGDIWTMTVTEYQASTSLKKLVYRLFRNSLILFGIGPTLLFLIQNRFPKKKSRLPTVVSILFTDILIVLIIIAAHYTVGIKQYMAVQLPVIALASSFGVWIFYINHQFEGVYWAHDDKWDRFQAAVKGSSFFTLPGILHWFTANIGYHYIHHLNYRIPNYNLDRCYKEIPELHEVLPLTLAQVIRSLKLALWDESSEKLIRFSELTRKNNEVPGSRT
jgi:omega-6 fatty acid desaturase (delta-12 desaturase)